MRFPLENDASDLLEELRFRTEEYLLQSYLAFYSQVVVLICNG
jgi:hypothetical protein